MSDQNESLTIDKADMDVLILAGGKGARLYPLTKDIPKPMVEIGGMPIIEHVVRFFLHFGCRRFKILTGHKSAAIDSYFKEHALDADIQCLFTGEEADTAERLWQVRNKVSERFFLSYADVLHNMDLDKLLALHDAKNAVCTMGAAPLQIPYGIVVSGEDDLATDYLEKPVFYDQWINGGLFCFNRSLFDHWDWQSKDFSRGMLIKLARIRQMASYQHPGFWSGMDTVRENEKLNDLWAKDESEWAMWRDADA